MAFLLALALASVGCGKQSVVRTPSEPGGYTAIVTVSVPLPTSCARSEDIVARVNGGQVAVLPPGTKELRFQFVAVIGVDYTLELALRSGAVLYSGPLNVKIVTEGFVNIGALSFECRATGP
jgi:hypothetical protein